ncbi:sensor domain-containing diguanylate cyclase [Vibrio sp. ZSDE26]|uniref:diguanylate cyclase n=1 Tax=Vibrio amylolyticus TaxID=2847292 RepID=A0A9X1XFT9_9VIBR|nr:sensor domain-containing diguanylate cyclase [Vibrio amylolyticus]MCK6262292.1 sensor domain-containing diguanylate cyclase [Vibrio amylolyticus]
MKFYKTIVPFFITSFVLVVITMLYYSQRYQAVKQESLEQSVNEAMEQISYTHREYRFLRSQVTSIAELLSNSRAMHDYIFSPTLFNKQSLEESWKSTMANQKWSPAIRYVDALGEERVKVNYSLITEDAKASIELGNESHREYFHLAQSLSERQIGSWGVDIEEEHDSISPINIPIFRIITPVMDMQEKAGYLVLNLDIGYISSRLHDGFSREFRPELISEKGYYIDSHRRNKLHGHLIERRAGYNLSVERPRVWQQLQSAVSGYTIENGNLFVFRRLEASSTQSIFIVVQANKEVLDKRLSRDLISLYQEVTLVFLVMLLFAVPTVFTFLHYKRRNLESKLARAAIDGMSAVVITDTKHQVVMVNNAFTRLTGFSQDEALNKNAYELVGDATTVKQLIEVCELLNTQSVWEGEVVTNRSSETPSTLITRVQAIRTMTEELDYYITTFVDITERKQLENQLRILSEKDELTSLFNRRKFERALLSHAQIVERYEERSPVCLALFDIDFFKRVNDEKGHDEGDRVIRVVAQTLQSNLRQTDMIARIGGEEFAVILPNTSIEEAVPVLERLRSSVEESIDVPVTVSGGYTDLTANSTDSYKRADIALYKAKALGRNQLAIVKSDQRLSA